MNIQVVMLTGDHQKSAEAVAKQVGIKSVKAQMSHQRININL
jgi:cation transport ATPase